MTMEIERPPVGLTAHGRGRPGRRVAARLAGQHRGLAGHPGAAGRCRAAGPGGRRRPGRSVRHGWLPAGSPPPCTGPATGPRRRRQRSGPRPCRRPRPRRGPALDARPVPDPGGSGGESLATLEQALAAPVSARHRGRLLVLAARTYLYSARWRPPAGRPTAHSPRPGRSGDTWATGWALHVLAIMATIGASCRRAAALRPRPRRDGDRPRARRPRPAAPDQQGRHAGQPRPVGRGAGTAEQAGQRADQVGTAVRLARRTAPSARCSSSSGGGTRR